MLRKISPPFPQYGALYYYADIIEHMRYSILNSQKCDVERVDEVLHYDIPEIHKRRQQLAEEVSRHMPILREEDVEHYRRHLYDLDRKWRRELTENFKRCIARP